MLTPMAIGVFQHLLHEIPNNPDLDCRQTGSYRDGMTFNEL